MTKSNLMGRHYRISSSVVLSPNVLRICAVRNNETLKLTTNAEKRIAHIRC